MGEFFHGWRRKLGVMTLVMACVCVAGWMRSEVAYDDVQYPFGEQNLVTLASVAGKIRLFVDCRPAPPLTAPHPARWASVSRNFEDDPVSTVWEWPFWTGQCLIEEKPVLRFCVVSYWLVTIPLTLLSAYLLLSKHRVAKPKPLSENPIPE